jgi:hypothetical protein
LLYIVDPTLSGIDRITAASIIDGMRPKLAHEPCRIVDRATELWSRPTDVGGLVVFNPQVGEGFDSAIADLIGHALRSGAVVMPVALDASRSAPPDPLSDVLAFRVDDVLRRRDLPTTALAIAGDELARRLLAELWPTCARSQLELFISYRRDEDCGMASQLRWALDELQDKPVRDVEHFRPGRPVASEILEKLELCDVFVLLDTPKARSSDWVRDELVLAMRLAIPIVWVQIGDRTSRADLPVWPSDLPDLELPVAVAGPMEALEIADHIRQRAFEVALAHVRRACVTLDRIRSIERLTVAAVEARQQIHCVSRPRHYRDLQLQPERHVIQIYGRRPSHADRRIFCEWFRAARSVVGSSIAGATEAYLLSSSPMPRDEEESVISTHGIAYVEAQDGREALSSSSELPELLLLGAFPRGEGSSQEIREAVHEIATTWLARGGRLRFGGHPTITPLIDNAASAVVAGREAEVVVVYRSAWFAERTLVDPVDTAATVVEIESTDDLDESLTLMRQRMVGDGSLVAVVAIGGRTSEANTHSPGVEEEVELARQRGLPVYLLGRAGGHTATMIERCRAEGAPWSSLANAMSPSENHELARTDDYWRVARTIWDRHVT